MLSCSSEDSEAENAVDISTNIKKTREFSGNRQLDKISVAFRLSSLRIETKSQDFGN